MSVDRSRLSDGARVLIIDDDPLIHALVGAMLKPINAHMVSANNGDEGLATARLQATDVILLDNEMPGATGLEILGQLKADTGLSSVPVIMQTGSESPSTLAACFAAGAADYIRKPFSAVELRARVGSVLEHQRLIRELTTAAETDKLTGLANRASLTKRLAEALERSHAGPSGVFTLLFLDFDRFKFVNDTLGHDVGDQLLKGIAARLQANLRSGDTIGRDAGGSIIARLGGDEFVIILDGVNAPETAGLIANRLLEALGAPHQLGTNTVRSTASIGLVYSSPEYLTADDMLRDADIAMYEAKRQGRACFVSFTSDMRDAVQERHALENDLRSALGSSQLYMAYQPIVSLEDKTIRGVEALARWEHPTRGDVLPDVFIPLAEETRLILPLSDWILRDSCQAFMQMRRAAPDSTLEYLSVNLSRVQLSDPSLVQRTLRIATECGMHAHELQLEVTESQIMQHRTIALGLLEEFKNSGVRLAMDDFGTGYSSLSCLHDFPLHVLKIDRTFVATSTRGHHHAALLHAAITLADNLGLTVVAEGLEEEEQLLLLQALGCGYGQGFLLAHPMRVEHIISLLNVQPMALQGIS